MREAARKGYLQLKKGQSLPTNDEELMKIKLDGRGKNWIAKDKMFLINVKGKGKVDIKNPSNQTDPLLFQVKVGNNYREFEKGEMRNPEISMRAFVNEKVGSVDSIYKVMLKVMNKYSDIFANSLLNIILKKNLYKELDENQFAFALITGVGDIDSKGNPKNLRVERAKGLYTILCGLSALNKGPSKYEVVLDDEKNSKSGAAKVYFILKKGKINVLDLELRYKGGFTSQPQFLGTLAPMFEDILKEQYGKKCKMP